MTIPADHLVFVAERIVAVGCLDLLSDMTLADRRALVDAEATMLADVLADRAADYVDELRESLKRSSS